MVDRSAGWEYVADAFVSKRGDIGADVVRDWALRNLAPSAAVLDIGCGSGDPISAALLKAGAKLFAIDAAPSMVAAFRARFPDVPVACEAAQESVFFHRKFDAIVAVGLLFLLAADEQRQVIERVAAALLPGGRFLFTTPAEACGWDDLLTGRKSVSLGQDAYSQALAKAGLSLVETFADAGGNHYLHAWKPAGGAIGT